MNLAVHIGKWVDVVSTCLGERLMHLGKHPFGTCGGGGGSNEDLKEVDPSIDGGPWGLWLDVCEV